MEKFSLCFIILFFINLPAMSGYVPIIKNCYTSANRIFKYYEDECKNFTQARIKSVSDQGIVEVQFSAPLACAVDNYVLTLQIVHEIISNKNECENVTLDNYWYHSEIRYSRINTSSELPPCNETEIIKFSEVYTGCYRVKISRNIISYSEHKFLETEYKMDKINNLSKVIANCRNDGNLTCFIDLSFNNTFNTNKIHLNFTLLTDNIEISKWKTQCLLNTGTEEDCDIIDNENNTVTCTSNLDGQPTIKCKFKNMEEAKHIKIELVDEPVRCTGAVRNVWGEALNLCEFNYSLKDIIKSTITTPITTTISPPKIEGNSILIVVVIVIILITICVIIIIYIRRKQIYDTQESPMLYSELRTREQENEDFDIFLVYARDCDVIMQTMIAFKLVLEEFTQRNVYDMHDPSTEQELSSGPEAWVLSRLSRRGAHLKTLLLATRCADLRLRDPPVLYKQRSCHDGLFPLAVRVIADSRRCSRYDSLFVVNFSGDTQEYDSFACFTPGKRFVLPESLHALLKELGCSETEGANSVIEMFYERCKEMQTFFTDYPEYLVDVLNVQVEDGCKTKRD